MNLKHLTDNILLADIKLLVTQERVVCLNVLQHLKEIEKRRLFSDLGFGSLFEYAVKELGYSEPSASRRIHSARLLNEFPELESKIEAGSLTMTNMALASMTFKKEKIKDEDVKREILHQIENTSKRECEKVLFSFSAPNPLPMEEIKIVKPNIYSVRWNISEKTLNLLEELKGLVAHRKMNQDEILFMAIETASEKIKNEKFKTNARLTTPVAKPCGKRFIKALVKKEVYERDHGRCTRCRGTYKLEYDHILPYAMGGKSTVENLRLLCFSCNQRRSKL